MNLSRDPFSIRRTSPAASLLRTSAASISQTAAQATHRAVAVTETFVEKSRKAISETSVDVTNAAGSMSTYGLPNGAASQWESSGRARFHHNDPERSEGFGEKMTNMFTGQRSDSLPMYKDKPYHYPGHGGKRHLPPWLRKKRTLGGVLAGLALVSWWFGMLSPLSWVSSKGDGQTSSPQGKSWSLFGSKEVVNWDERAERVKDAFKISWAGYEKYGWGTCQVCLSRRMNC